MERKREKIAKQHTVPIFIVLRFGLHSLKQWARKKKKKLSLKHPDWEWGLTMMSLHKAWQRCQSQAYRACSHTSVNTALSAIHLRPSWTLAGMPVPVQQWALRKWCPCGPSGAPGMRVRDGKLSESCNSELWTCGHCEICLWKGLNEMMYYKLRLVKVSEPVIYSQASYTDTMTLQSEGNWEQKHKLDWVDKGRAWGTLWSVSCRVELCLLLRLVDVLNKLTHTLTWHKHANMHPLYI